MVIPNSDFCRITGLACGAFGESLTFWSFTPIAKQYLVLLRIHLTMEL